MKKIIAILMALCLLCASCAAMADMEAPNWDDMPAVIIEDENTTVDEAAFEGEWVLNLAFFDTVYIDEQTLASMGFNFMPITITEGKISQDLQQENGEFITVDMPYTFEAGQLQGTDDTGMDFVVELLEDGNIVVTLFLPGEGETVSCLSVFMVHPEE